MTQVFQKEWGINNMKEKEIQRKLFNDFTQEEIRKLATKPATTISEIAKTNSIIVDDSKSDSIVGYLQSWFLDTFIGDPIELPWDKFLVELTTCNNQLIKIFCCKQKNDWVSLDIFVNGWLYIGKIMYPNIKCDEADRTESGQFMIYTPFLNIGNKIDHQVLQTLIPICKDIFTYGTMYVVANKDVEEVYYEKGPKGKVKRKHFGGTKSSKTTVSRDRVYVPKRVYTVKRLPKADECIRNYLLSHWKVRGYTYTRKDGKVINVKEHIARRHLPNKGLTKPEGTDYVIRKPQQ